MRSYLLLFAALLLAFAACNSSNRDKAFNEYLSTADSTKFSSDITDPHSASRKILHSADLEYRVADVLKATTKTEQLVNSMSGVVVKSELTNQSVSNKDIPWSGDSLKRIQIYEPQASMIVKVPVPYMDSFINRLSADAQFVITRTTAQQDITYAYLSNALKNQNAENKAAPAHYKEPSMDAKKELAADTSKQKVADEVVDRRVENLQILDETNYATLVINYRQQVMVDEQIITDVNRVTRTPLALQLSSSFGEGINLFRALLVFFVGVWPLWLIGVIVWVVYKRRIFAARK